MKKAVFFLILFSMPLIAFSQDTEEWMQRKKKYYPGDPTLPYKTFEEFNNDTLAYLEYNFVDRSLDSYAGMKVQDLMDMLPFPVVLVSASEGLFGGEGAGAYSFSLFIFLEWQPNKLDGKRALLSIEVGVDPVVSWKDYDIARTNYDPRDLIKDYTVTYAILYKGLWLDSYKEIIENRKKLEEARKAAEAGNDIQ